MSMIWLLVLATSIQLASSLNCFLPKDERAFEKANKLLENREVSEELRENVQTAGRLIQEESLGCEVREILEDFAQLKETYRDSCDRDTFESVRGLYERMPKVSRSNIAKAVRPNGRLKTMIIASYDQMVNDCLYTFGMEYLDALKRESVQMKSHKLGKIFYEQSIGLISDANRKNIPQQDKMVRKVLEDLRQANFKRLETMSTHNERAKWANFMRRMSHQSGNPLETINVHTGEKGIQWPEIEQLFGRFFTKRCKRLLEGQMSKPLEKIDDLLSWSRLDSIDFKSFTDSQWLEHMLRSVNWRICKELKDTVNLEFLSKLLVILQNRMWEVFG